MTQPYNPAYAQPYQDPNQHQPYPPQFGPPQGQPQYQQPQNYGPPPQQYGPPQGQPQQVALAQGTLDQFYSQPSTGQGAALKFEQVGVEHFVIIARDVANADVQQQTMPGSNVPMFFRDGRPKFVMKVPCRVAPTAANPDGLAQWFCGGQARDQLQSAMAACGAEGAPKAGWGVRIKLVGKRPSGPGMNPANVFEVQYYSPDVARHAAGQFGIPYPDGVAAPAQGAPPAPSQAPPAAIPAATPVASAQPNVVVDSPAPPAPGDSASLSAEKQELLRNLSK